MRKPGRGKNLSRLRPHSWGRSCYKLGETLSQGNGLATIYRPGHYVMFFNFAVSHCWKCVNCSCMPEVKWNSNQVFISVVLMCIASHHAPTQTLVGFFTYLTRPRSNCVGMIWLRVELNSWKERCVPHAIEGLNSRATGIASTCTIFTGTLFVSRDCNSFKTANSTGGVI